MHFLAPSVRAIVNGTKKRPQCRKCAVVMRVSSFRVFLRTVRLSNVIAKNLEDFHHAIMHRAKQDMRSVRAEVKTGQSREQVFASGVLCVCRSSRQMVVEPKLQQR